MSDTTEVSHKVSTVSDEDHREFFDSLVVQDEPFITCAGEWPTSDEDRRVAINSVQDVAVTFVMARLQRHFEQYGEHAAGFQFQVMVETVPRPAEPSLELPPEKKLILPS